jgi:hypothetical protein
MVSEAAAEVEAGNARRRRRRRDDIPILWVVAREFAVGVYRGF